MTTPLLKAPHQIAVKVESTAGTAETIAATDCVYAMDAEVKINQGKEEMNPVLAGLGKAASIYSGRDGTFNFSMFLKGSGTAGTAPALSVPLQMAGFTFADVGTTRSLYTLEGTRSSMKTATVKKFLGEIGASTGRYNTLRGCMARAVITCKPSKAGTVAFDGLGAYQAYGDVAMPEPTFETTDPPVIGSLTGRILKYHSVRTTSTGGTAEKLRDGAASNIKLAVTISNGTAEVKLDRIQFHATLVGTPANETHGVWVTIEGDSTGDPNGSAITSGTSAYKATTEFDTTGELVSFVFTTPPTLAASTVYHAVIQGDYDADASNCISFDCSAAVAEGSQVSQYYDAAWAAIALKNLTCNVLLQIGTTSSVYLDGFVLDTGAEVTLKKDWNATDGNERAEINRFPDFNIVIEPLTTTVAVRDWIDVMRDGDSLYFFADIGSTAGNSIDLHAHDLYIDEDAEEAEREGRLMETLTLRSEIPQGRCIINFR
jgi:hypothetical protein